MGILALLKIKALTIHSVIRMHKLWRKNVLIKLPVLLQSDYNQFVISLNLKKEIFWAQKTKTKPSVSSYDYLFEREGDVW